MLETGSLKRSIETNKIQKDRVMAKVGKKGQNNIRNKKWGLQRLDNWTFWKFYDNKFENLHKANSQQNSQLTKIDSGREKHLISTDHQENLISYQ